MTRALGESRELFKSTFLRELFLLRALTKLLRSRIRLSIFGSHSEASTGQVEIRPQSPKDLPSRTQVLESLSNWETGMKVWELSVRVILTPASFSTCCASNCRLICYCLGV